MHEKAFQEEQVRGCDEGFRILVVDADAKVRGVLSTSLLLAAHTVWQAESALQAMRVLRTSPVDLVLIDDLMPDLDAMAAIRVFRSLPGCKKLPMIFVTGKDRSNRWALEVGATGVIMKPFSPLALSASVAAIMLRHRGSRPLRAVRSWPRLVEAFA